MEIFEDHYQRNVRSDRLHRVTDFAQHPLTSRALDLALQRFAFFALHQRGKLDQPGRSLRTQGLDDCVSVRATARLTQSFQHRVIRFLASVALDALTARESNHRQVGRYLARKFVGHGGLTDAGFASNENDLPLMSQGPLQAIS